MVDFLMPESDRDKGENPIVDSLAMGKYKKREIKKLIKHFFFHKYENTGYL